MISLQNQMTIFADALNCRNPFINKYVTNCEDVPVSVKMASLIEESVEQILWYWRIHDPWHTARKFIKFERKNSGDLKIQQKFIMIKVVYKNIVIIQVKSYKLKQFYIKKPMAIILANTRLSLNKIVVVRD